MYFSKNNVIVHLVLFLLIINFNEDFFALKKKKIKIVSGLQFDNPWLSLHHIFAFTEYHSSGVYNDLSGLIQYNETEFYRFPIGKCPVYGKLLMLSDGEHFYNTATSDNFSPEYFLEYLRTGRVPGDEHPVGLNMPVEQLSQNIQTFKYLKSPEKKESIYECALHAKKFEHPVPSIGNITNCFIEGRQQSCVKHPFIYDTIKKMCYILFPLWQQKAIGPSEDSFIYYPFKSIDTNNYVFGSSSIQSDWEKFCPKRPIKDVIFGAMIRNGCFPAARRASIASFKECVELLFKYSSSDGYNRNSRRSNGIASNWANWYNNTCEILTEVPDCLFSFEGGIAFTSTGIADGLQYDLPPCINASEKWNGEIPCGNSTTEKFICTKGKWTNENNKTVEECQNNVEKDINGDQSRSMRSWQNGGIISIIFLFIILLN